MHKTSSSHTAFVYLHLNILQKHCHVDGWTIEIELVYANWNMNEHRIETKRKCGVIIFALVWISKVVFTQLCVSKCCFFVFFKFSKSFDAAAVQRTQRRFCLFFLVIFFLLLVCLFVWLCEVGCLFNELNWKVNTPSVAKWLVWTHSCQVFPRLNTIFTFVFVRVPSIRFAMHTWRRRRRRWGWQVIVHDVAVVCAECSTCTKNVVKYTQRHTETVNSEHQSIWCQWFEMFVCQLRIDSVALNHSEFIVILSCTRVCVCVVRVCLWFWTIQPSFHHPSEHT